MQIKRQIIKEIQDALAEIIDKYYLTVYQSHIIYDNPDLDDDENPDAMNVYRIESNHIEITQDDIFEKLLPGL